MVLSSGRQRHREHHLHVGDAELFDRLGAVAFSSDLFASATAAALAGVATKSSSRVSWPSIGSHATGCVEAAPAAAAPLRALRHLEVCLGLLESRRIGLGLGQCRARIGNQLLRGDGIGIEDRNTGEMEGAERQGAIGPTVSRSRARLPSAALSARSPGPGQTVSAGHRPRPPAGLFRAARRQYP
jgi:hypothetical protein